MQNKRLIRLGLSILTLGLVILFITAYRILHYPSATTKLPIIKTHTVLVVDFDRNKKLSTADILSGNDAILIVKSMQNSPKKDMWFNSFGALVLLDLNKDGRIDKKDPIYNHMGLLFFDAAMQHKYVSLADAGIEAIVINKAKIKGPEKQLSNEEFIGKALLKQGDERAVRLLKVNIEL